MNLKPYYILSKPGIVYGNLLSVFAGFFLASKFHPDIKILISITIGVAFIIASSCAMNNVIDINIDSRMKRTLKRPTVTGEISKKNAYIYSTIIGILGFIILIFGTNALTALLGLIGVFSYVVLYGVSKRKTIYSTLIGSISGAIPLVAGYTAVTGKFNITAIILFFIMAAWQMPHFYSIAIYRLNDYKEAGLVLWPIKRGIKETKIQILIYTCIFCIASMALVLSNNKGYIYLVLIIVLSSVWIIKGIKGLYDKNDEKWAKGMFFYSLISLLIFSALLAIPWI